MASTITLPGIRQAVINLGYKNPRTYKCRLVQFILNHYETDAAIETLTSIASDAMIRYVWEIDTTDSAKIASKKRNLISLVSSINHDFNQLFHSNQNPEGIIIGPSNIFEMSDQAKSNLLHSFTNAIKTDGEIDLNKISEVLKVITDFLKEIDEDSKDDETKDIIEKIKKILSRLSDSILNDEEPLPPEDVETIEIEADEEVEEIEIDENEEIEVVEVGEDDLIEEVEESEGESDDETVEIGAEEELEEVLIDQDEEIDDVVLDEDEDIDVIELDDDEEIEEIEDEDIEEVEIDEDQEIEEIEEEDLEEVLIDQDEEIDDIVLDEEENIDVVELDDDEEIEEIEDEDGDIEEVEIDEDQEIEEIEEEDLEEVLIDEDEEIDDIVLDEEEDIDVVELDDDEEIEEVAEDEVEVLEDEGGLSVSDETTDFPMDGEQEAQDKKRLSEEFESYLGAMEKFYNQYLHVPAGKYRVGAKNPKNIEIPEQTFFTPGIYLGKFPVTNALFEIFVNKTGYITTAEKRGFGTVYFGRYQKIIDKKTGLARSVWQATYHKETVSGACWHQPFGPGSSLHAKKGHPVVQISLEDALMFASYIGKRLPTEFEWEAAARTQKGTALPWGEVWDDAKCNMEHSGIADTSPVEAYMSCENELGIADALGNVFEWTLDAYRPSVAGEKPISPHHIVKGGSFISDNTVRLFSRFMFKPDFTANIIGFRCLAD